MALNYTPRKGSDFTLLVHVAIQRSSLNNYELFEICIHGSIFEKIHESLTCEHSQ